LTREPAADHVDGLQLLTDRAHVIEAARIRPALREHCAAPRVALDLPHRAPTRRSFDAEVQAADAAEQ
jgi:hypothetical protein